MAGNSLALREWVVILLLIFGGCCSNVFTLEKLVVRWPKAGNLITFIQFLFVSAEGLCHFFSPSTLSLRPRAVPLSRYCATVVLFFFVNTANNYVWRYNISVPAHIIFRSCGTVTTMIVGYCAGKRYSVSQVIPAVILSIGVICATISNSPSRPEACVVCDDDILPSQPEQKLAAAPFGIPERLFGILLLLIAAIVSAIMSIYTENTFKKYGKNWRENLFYSHLLALPLFYGMRDSISDTFRQIVASEPTVEVMGTAVPVMLGYLLLNGLTQYVCTLGVNRLAGNTTALTVTITLNVRKFVSLLLSIWLFGNKLTTGTVVGTSLVFGSALMYGYASTQLRAAKSEPPEDPKLADSVSGVSTGVNLKK